MALRDWITTTTMGSQSLATHSPPQLPTLNPANSRNSRNSNSNYSENYSSTPTNSRNSRNSNSNYSENYVQVYPLAVKRLEAAAQGLPVTLDELLAFYNQSDLEAFQLGEVKQATIRFSVELYATKKAQAIWLDHYP